jgi:hypothetical protein
MNVRIGIDTAQFLSWEYINVIFVAAHALKSINSMISMHLRTLYFIQFCQKYITASILGYNINFFPSL